jgi:hypothetical protein
MSDTEPTPAPAAEPTTKIIDAPAAEPTPAPAPAPAPAAVTASAVARIVADLREAGATGKKQWEEALTTTRALAAKAPARTRAELEAALGRVRTTLSSSMERAQGRGAGLLLRLVREVRTRAERAEAQLGQQTVAPQ